MLQQHAYPLRLIMLALCGLGLVPRETPAQAWRLEAGPGLAYNVPMPLRIEQTGQPTLRITAQYATRAFELPLYWTARLERRVRSGAWGVELLHHKLFLANEPAEVDRFQVTHGFNVVSVTRSWTGRPAFRAGVGVVLAHPETVVRGLAYPQDRGLLGMGYYLTGPALQLGVSRRWALRRGLRAQAGLKLVGAHARLPVAAGRAILWHLGLHADAGLSYTF